MTRAPIRREHRRAATLVEFAMIAVAFVLVLFGIFEYARFVFLLHVAENAAREGARYAVVHTGDGTTKQQVIDEVTRRMATRQSELDDFAVEVMVVNPDTGTTITGTAWNQASFGTSIGVKVTGKFKPFLPGLTLLAGEIPIQRMAMMSSEAN